MCVCVCVCVCVLLVVVVVGDSQVEEDTIMAVGDGGCRTYALCVRYAYGLHRRFFPFRVRTFSVRNFLGHSDLSFSIEPG